MSRLKEIAGSAAFAIIATSSSAHAEVQVQAGGGYRYEDNLFRLPKGRSILADGKRSDRIASVNGQIDADFHPDDYDGTLTAVIANDWYARNTRLNNFNYSLGLNVARRPGAKLDIVANAESDRRLSSFTDLTSAIRNIQALQRFSATVTYPISPDIRIVTVPEYQRSTNSSDRLNSNDYNRYGGGVGLGYYSPIGNSIAVTVSRRQTDGIRDRLVFVGGIVQNAKINIVDTSIDVRLNYRPSTFTTITATVSYVDRNDKSVLNNNYHGPAGNVAFIYEPRETLRAQVDVGRLLDTQSYLFVDSIRTDYVDGSVDAVVADNIQAGLRAAYQRRRFLYDPLSGQSNRIERIYRFTASVSWLVLERLNLSVSAFHEHRSANYQFGNYNANVVQGTATFVLGKRGVLLNGQSGVR